MLYLTLAIVLIVLSIIASARGIALQKRGQNARRAFGIAIGLFFGAVVVYFVPLLLLMLGF